ncbi:MAG: sporulation transcription factor Spo0A [Firmicutes bacterium]|nr:sporulation transcription factor Spo0A [Bacillota bacterium]
MKAKILIVDDNDEFANEMKEFFNSSDKYEVVGCANDGVKGLAMFDELKPDIMLLDLVMPQMDGFSVLERMHKGSSKVLVISALNQDTFISRAMNLGADYYMMKPVNFSNLSERIDGLLNPKAINGANPPLRAAAQTTRLVRHGSMDEKITNIFITVGIPAHIKGYHFLREAIKMAIDNPDIINNITKRLYPEVAGRFSTTSSKVERAIRHAIEVAWNRGKIENINSLFGIRVYNHNEKPTNGEFIALVADKMLLESV